ncbi:MAG TPA: hypothetical protein VF331_04380 [Polyangiales bacterium]
MPIIAPICCLLAPRLNSARIKAMVTHGRTPIESGRQVTGDPDDFAQLSRHFPAVTVLSA